jgi:YidC/Oxa1 family membrane protein insertase
MLPLNSQNDPGDQKNMLLAILLSVCVLLAWQYFYANPKVESERKRQQEIAAQQKQPQRAAPGQAGTSDGAAPVAPGAAGTQPGSVTTESGTAPVATSISREAALARSPRLAIETPSLVGSINLKGGRIDDLKLAKHHVTIDPTSPLVTLFSPANAPMPYFSEHGWVTGPGSKIKLPGRDTQWTAADGAKLSATTPVTLTWSNDEGLTFSRTISVDENYMFTIKDSVENKTGDDVLLFPYARIYRGHTPKLEGFWVQHEGLIGFLGEANKLQQLDYKEVREPGGNKTFENVVGGWLGFTDKYWAAAMIPNQKTPYRANLKATRVQTETADAAYQTDYLLPSVTIAAGQSQSVEQRLFAGAKNISLIQSYEEDDGVYEFSYLVDWGWFYFITKPLYQLLHFLYGVFGNFGVAILTTTVLVKLAFFWFANKSYESMAKMKKVQPEMTSIRERYKDDKMRQQQELMALYKKEKINPLAGCLPVLIQIPVFFALYKVLFVSIDMRHAPFFGWIQDLSAKDPTSLFNLFGALPYDVPDFLVVGIWPLIMGITMFVQMQLNPQQPDPVQQQVFNWMPVMFTFLLASFPAGLVIYWAWNNVLSLAQQWFIMKRQGVDIPLMDNLRRKFGAIGKFFGGLTSRSKG